MGDIVTIGKSVSDLESTEPDTDIVEAPAPKHAYGCIDGRCVLECPYALSQVSDTELERMGKELHQVGAWTARFLLDEDGDETEDLLQRAVRIFRKL